MDEQKIADLVKNEVMQWYTSQQNHTDGYEYEKSFVTTWRRLGQKVLQESMGSLPGSKNEKKTQNDTGRCHRAEPSSPGKSS